MRKFQWAVWLVGIKNLDAHGRRIANPPERRQIRLNGGLTSEGAIMHTNEYINNPSWQY